MEIRTPMARSPSITLAARFGSRITMLSVISTSINCGATPLARMIAPMRATRSGSWNWLADRFTATGSPMPSSCQRRARSHTCFNVQ